MCPRETKKSLSLAQGLKDGIDYSSNMQNDRVEHSQIHMQVFGGVKLLLLFWFCFDHGDETELQSAIISTN